MVLADTIGIFLIVLGVMISLPGLWLLCRGLWPGAVERSAEALSRGQIKAFFVGLPIIAAVVVAIMFLGQQGSIGGVILIILGSIAVVYSSVGIAGLATSVGRKLPSPGDDARSWQVTLRGSIVLVLSFLLPVVGWFVILPAALLIGCGSTTLNLRKKVAKGLE